MNDSFFGILKHNLTTFILFIKKKKVKRYKILEVKYISIGKIHGFAISNVILSQNSYKFCFNFLISF